MAPEANIIAIKILDKDGKGNSADALLGMQWIYDNAEKYNIRIVNLSIGTDDTGSEDPLVKGVEALWEKGIVMTIAAGNNGPRFGSVTSPGISRKVITVGSYDDNEPKSYLADSLLHFSGRGPTSECIIKPDVVAPGDSVTSCYNNSLYVQLSGTSMSTPIVSGAIALLLEKKPNLSPDEIKYLLKKTSINMNFPRNRQGWGMLNVEALLNSV